MKNIIKKDIFESLNKEQYTSAISNLGSNLVLAGAGTGKTSTIVGRVVYLLTKLNIEAKDIILLTFTRKASIEMKERLARYIDKKVVMEISISNFHSLCFDVVKKEYPNKKLIANDEPKKLLESTYAKAIQLRPEGMFSEATLLSYFENYINSNSDFLFSEWLDQEIEIKDNKEYLLEQYQLIYDLYEEDKKKYNIITLSELLIYAKKHFIKSKKVIQEIIVDEFQDTNPLQHSVLEAINPKSLFCVGDYDQSIYSFNGADLTQIEEFGNRDNFMLYNLSKNYRCQRFILEIAEKVIVNNDRIYPKSLEVMIDKPYAMKPYCIASENILEQYAKTSEMAEDIMKTKAKNESVAILYRSNSSGDGVELALKERGLEIERSVKNTFMENIEVKMIFNILKLMLYSNINYLEFFNLFTGIVEYSNKSAIESYYQMITAGEKIDVKNGLINDKAKQIDKNNGFFKNSKESVISLIALSKISSTQNISKTIKEIIESKFFNNTINNMSIMYSKDDDEKANKLYKGYNARANAVLKIAKKYSDSKKFYNDLMRTTSDDDNDVEDNSKIHLLTVHGSKGLEYNYVFVIDMDDETFPNKKLMGKNEDDEERRLFYVATTRAKDWLIFQYSKIAKNGKKSNKPSRFLIEADLIE